MYRQPHTHPAIYRPELRDSNTLHVVGVVSNPARFHSRYRLAREWLAHMDETPNVRAYLCEAAYGERQHEIANGGSERHLQLRTRTEAWIKESMINCAVRYLLPRDWRYVAWVDADVEFRDYDWAQEALHELQHWAVIQPWQNCIDLGPKSNVMGAYTSFGYVKQTGQLRSPRPHYPYPFPHTGYAWACRRDFWEAVGGLLDHCILGSADHHMAWACVGRVRETVHGNLHPAYLRRLLDWQTRALKVTHGEVGYSRGHIEHFFHGSKKHRHYKTRWQIMVDLGYNPDRDLIHDEQGLIRLHNRADLDQAIRLYNRSRNEDSTDE